MTPLQAEKQEARERAYAARAKAHAAGAGAAERASEQALAALRDAGGAPGTVSAYLAIRSEIDAMPLMLALSDLEIRVVLPVVVGAGRPLVFREWVPGAALETGPFGTSVPRDGVEAEPDVLFAPMLAFDARCNRLGYGGGFYDRTIAELRLRRSVLALGFAYAAQAVPSLPVDANDMRLDAVVTEEGILRADGGVASPCGRS